ncbi:hypothetical protein J4466_03070 [Candidatus Pacearchaeota archaeon]|nr:hypothetical protein [Candidatus Pacearchaeota archaeon]
MANKREIPGDRSFVDRQGNVVYPSTENSRFLILQRGESENPGKAYAFFDCDASESYLKEVMQGIVEDSESPKGLELSVQEGISGLKLDENLVKAIQYPDDYRIMTSKRIIKERERKEREKRPAVSLKYSLITKCPGLSNEDTAKRTGNVMNYVRTLNKDSDVFRCALVYEKEGEYHLL